MESKVKVECVNDVEITGNLIVGPELMVSDPGIKLELAPHLRQFADIPPGVPVFVLRADKPGHMAAMAGVLRAIELNTKVAQQFGVDITPYVAEVAKAQVAQKEFDYYHEDLEKANQTD